MDTKNENDKNLLLDEEVRTPHKLDKKLRSLYQRKPHAWVSTMLAVIGLSFFIIGCGAPGGDIDKAEEVASLESNLTRSYYFSVPESASTWIDTGVDVGPGDRVVFTGGNVIWAGFWYISANGPDGLREFANETRFPVTTANDPNARRFSLVGSFGGSERFQIGSGVTKTAPGARRIYLRTNDDVPGNGEGAFDCYIQVESARGSSLCYHDWDCGYSEKCVYNAGTCGGTGSCVDMSHPRLCTAVFDPVCGCDGISYSNACSAANAGASIARKGLC